MPMLYVKDAKIRWLKILWLRHEQLAANVRKELEAVTKNKGKVSEKEVGLCLLAVESELGKVETALLDYGAWSSDPNFGILTNKKKSLGWTRDRLKTFKR